MEKYEEIDFIRRLNVDRLKPTQSGFTGRCQICGDSKKSKTKTRLHFLFAKGYVEVYCHNCGLNTNLKNYIYSVDRALYEEYVIAERKYLVQNLQSNSFFSKRSEPRINNITTNLQYVFKLNEKSFKSIAGFPKHLAYCKQRKLPNETIQTLKVCVNKKLPYFDMVIFPFWFDSTKVYGFQGRTINRKQFLTNSPNSSFKVYNLFNVDKTKPVIVTEAIIDSYSIKNSIAMLGSDLSENVQTLLSDTKLIFAFDNDETGLLKSIKYAEHGKKVFVWPNEIKTKDFNDLTKKGISSDKLTKMVLMNSCSGLELITKLKLKQLRKR